MRDVLRDNHVSKLYCNCAIPFYGSFMLILWWCYNYLLFLAYIWIDKIYDSDELPLTQMVLQITTGVNTEDKYVENEEDDENYKDMSNEVANKCIFCF